MSRETPTDARGAGQGRRVLDLVFVVDCSGSMTGERIGALNWAARTVIPTIRAQAEDHPGVDLRIRVLRFATGAFFTAPQAEPVETFTWNNLAAGGESDMGTAFKLLASALEASGDGERLAPVIVLFSDGYPSDDVEAGLQTLIATDPGRRSVRIPIAIGQDADMALLRRFSSDPALQPLRSHDVEMLIGRMHGVIAGPIAGALARGDAHKAAEPKAGEDEDLW